MEGKLNINKKVKGGKIVLEIRSIVFKRGEDYEIYRINWICKEGKRNEVKVDKSKLCLNNGEDGVK